MITDPFANYLRFSEQIRQLTEGPAAQLVKQQRAVEALLMPAAMRAAEAQRATQKILDSPATKLLEQHEQIQRAMESPLRRFAETQAALQQQLRSPLASIVRNQQYLQRTIEALANVEVDEAALAAIPEDPGREAELLGWLVAWRDQVATLHPTPAQAVALLEAVCFLISVILFFMPDLGCVGKEITAGTLLIGAGCLILRYTEES